MHIWVLPVSGGSFPKQLGLITALLELGLKPDVVLAASGGNVAAYAAAAADWEADGIDRVSRCLDTDLFLSSWWPNPLDILPSWLIGFFRGSIYKQGCGGVELFHTLFSPRTIARTEIWTGTTNMVDGKAHLFCNRCRDDSLIDLSHFNPTQAGCASAEHLNGDVTMIAKATIASASIPTLVPGQAVAETPLYDGGVLFASPLTPLQDAITHSAKGELHIDYVSSFDMESDQVSFESYTMMQIGTMTFAELVRSLCRQDRLAAIELIKRCGSKVHYTTGVAADLPSFQEMRRSSHYSLLEIYPLYKEEPLDLAHFSGEQVVALSHKVQGQYGLRLWWA